MLSLSVISNKQYIKRDGIEILDLTHQSMEYSANIRSMDFVVVSNEIAGRPHALAKIAYGTESDLDLLMDFNGISNPMSIEAGDIIAIPDIEYLYNSIATPEADNIVVANNKMSTTKDVAKQRLMAKLRNIDPRMEQKTYKPNEAKDGTSDITIENGVITLGTNTSNVRCKGTLSEVQSLTERIRKAIKENI